MTEAQQTFHNLSGMLADQGTGKTVARWGFREFKWGILDLAHPQGRMLHLQIHLPVAQLRVVFHPVCRTLHGQGAYASSLTALDSAKRSCASARKVWFTVSTDSARSSRRSARSVTRRDESTRKRSRTGSS